MIPHASPMINSLTHWLVNSIVNSFILTLDLDSASDDFIGDPRNHLISCPVITAADSDAVSGGDRVRTYDTSLFLTEVSTEDCSTN